MRTLLNKLPAVARILLGLVFFVFGLNGFLHFLPQPPMSGPAGELAGAFAASKYLFPLIKGTEVTAGVLLLAGRFVPLALVLLAPVLVNIVAFHLFLAPGGVAMPVVLVAIELYLAWSYRDVFRPMLAADAKPAKVDAQERAARATA